MPSLNCCIRSSIILRYCFFVLLFSSANFETKSQYLVCFYVRLFFFFCLEKTKNYFLPFVVCVHLWINRQCPIFSFLEYIFTIPLLHNEHAAFPHFFFIYGKLILCHILRFTLASNKQFNVMFFISIYFILRYLPLSSSEFYTLSFVTLFVSIQFVSVSPFLSISLSFFIRRVSFFIISHHATLPDSTISTLNVLYLFFFVFIPFCYQEYGVNFLIALLMLIN